MSHVLPLHLTCKEIVERVSDYIDGAIDAAEAERFEHHLVSCGACVTYFDQMTSVVEAAAELGYGDINRDIDPSTADALVRALSASAPKKEG